MARKERGLFRMIFRDFLKSVTPHIPKRTCVGEDYMGTKYYEITEIKVSIHKKPNRYFVPKEEDNFEQELPAEWEAWLRGRRQVPPTADEVNENYQMILTKRENAAILEAEHAKTKEIDIVTPNAKPLNEHSSMNFPVYEEYKDFGRDYKPKWKKN